MATMAEEEFGIELECAPHPSSPMTDPDSIHTTNGKASRLQRGFEEGLKNEPVIVHFGGQAGAVVKEATPSNNQYRFQIGLEICQIDKATRTWFNISDGAHGNWRSMFYLFQVNHNPFNLIQIAYQLVEHLRLSFKNSNELNKIIEKFLPGRPSFKRHEVMVGNKVCEVFFRDINACIRALFGDPNFNAVIVLVPEKHYTDEGQKVRMYHDTYLKR